MKWDYRVELGDIFHADIPWVRKRDEIVRRVERATKRCLPDWELEELVADMQASNTSTDFDEVWDEFYNWADMNRVWINTSARAVVSVPTQERETT